MTSNVYRVGDYVYFEASSTSPYQIRRIEELNKAPSGNVEAKVLCFYRRRDLPTPLVQLADKHQMAQSEDSPVAMKLKKMWLKTPVSEEQAAQAVLDPALVALEEERNSPNNNSSEERKGEQLSTKQRHQMKHRELFLSRQLETLPANHIRGKCSVTMLNEEESLLSYLNKDDTFFYCLVFDPVQKTLLADKGEIRVGSRYQTEVQALLREGDSDGRNLSDLETLIWTPNHSLTDRQIDQFLVVSRSIGTFARALDCSSSVKQPSLHMSAAAASRDITLFHAMDTLHKNTYSIEGAMSSLVPSSGPVLCRDEMEEWSASEANLFEEALEKYGKDFNDIRNDFLPWKTSTSLVEYYYMWKTTDRYVQQKRVKAVEAESKLKQVYIPAYTRPSPAIITNNRSILNGTPNGNGNDVLALNGVKPCESCAVASSREWYAWGPNHLNCRLCHVCWTYWKRYGGLKVASRLAETELSGDAAVKKRAASSDIDEDRLAQMPHRPHRSGSPRPIMKTRTAFYLLTNATTRLSRRVCRRLIRSKKAARQPSFAINLAAVKQEYALMIANRSPTELNKLLYLNKKERERVTNIANRLGNPGPTVGEWLKLTPRDMMPKPEKESFPKPPKAPDGSLMYERIPNKVVDVTNERVPINTQLQQQPPSLRKRPYEEVNGIDNPVPPPTKRPNKDPMPSHRPTPEQYAAMMAAAAAAGQPLPRHHLNGKPKIAQMARTGSGRKHVISWMDAPDDVYFRSTESSRSARRNISVVELRRAARKPWRQIKHHTHSGGLSLHHATAPTTIPPQTQTSINSGDLQVVILD